MKSRLLCAAALISMFSINADATTNTYVGANLGVRTVTTNGSASTKFRGWLPGLYIGYGGMMGEEYDDYYLAGELAISWASEISDTYVVRTQSLRMSPEVSISIIPGMMLKPDLLGFMRFGFGEANLVVRSQWLAAGILGAGLEYGLTPCWSLRGEFDYSFFRNATSGTPRAMDFVLALKYTYDV